MLNEIIEDTKSMRNVKVECFNIHLTEDQKIRLVLEFTSTPKKEYVTKEKLWIDNQLVDSQIELIKIRVFLKRFTQNILKKSEKNKYFTLVQKTEDKEIIKTLEYFNTETNEKHRISQIDAQAILEIWNLSFIGYNRVKIIEKNRTFSGNSMSVTTGDNMMKFNLEGNTDFLTKAVCEYAEDL